MSAKELVLRPIDRAEANALVCRLHCSHTYVRNSWLHFGIFWRGRLEGAAQFGPSLDKRKVIGLVRGTPWNGFLELNRFVCSEALPKNAESRALAVAARLIARHAPHVKWLLSFSDGTRSGHGTIYQAAGWLLTGVRRNTSVWELPTGEYFIDLMWGKNVSQQRRFVARTTFTKGVHIRARNGSASMRPLIELGARPLPGFQVRYVKLLDPTWRDRLTVPALPCSRIDELHAGMYLGRPKDQAPASPAGLGGETPTRPLHHDAEVARG